MSSAASETGRRWTLVGSSHPFVPFKVEGPSVPNGERVEVVPDDGLTRFVQHDPRCREDHEGGPAGALMEAFDELSEELARVSRERDELVKERDEALWRQRDAEEDRGVAVAARERAERERDEYRENFLATDAWHKEALRERDQAERERDEARAEVERLREALADGARLGEAGEAGSQADLTRALDALEELSGALAENLPTLGTRLAKAIGETHLLLAEFERGSLAEHGRGDAEARIERLGELTESVRKRNERIHGRGDG